MADTKISALNPTTAYPGSAEIPVNEGGTNFKWLASALGGLTRRTLVGADTLVASDRGKMVEATSGTFSLAITAAATLGNGWWCWFYNSGTGVVTLDPNGTETLDGATTVAVRRGTRRLIMCDGVSFYSTPVGAEVQVFPTAGGPFTWTKPPGAVAVRAIVIAGGGQGGSGRKGAAARAGGIGGTGGGTSIQDFQASLLGDTESVTVGAGGTGAGAAQSTNSTNGNNGNAGSDSSFGSWLTAKGGNGGPGGSTVSIAAGGTVGGIGATRNGGPSGNVNVTIQPSAPLTDAIPSGGGGGGVTVGGSELAGAPGGASLVGSLSGGANGGVHTPGSSPSDQSASVFGGGAGGGGGGGSLTGSNGAAGAKGGKWGGGGGGGGAGTDSAVDSGPGGDGGDGLVAVFTFF